jgi:hypothetical protein
MSVNKADGQQAGGRDVKVPRVAALFSAKYETRPLQGAV